MAHPGIGSRQEDYAMRPRRLLFGRLVFTFAACLLVCGIVSTEVPEFFSLTDVASNDFAIVNADDRECIPTLNSESYKSVPVETRNFECGARSYRPPVFS